MTRLRHAVEIARQEPPQLIAGDALALLPAVMAQVPPNTTLCIFHSFTVNQFSPEGRERLSSLLQDRSTQRPIFRISLEELPGERYPRLDLTRYVNGTKTEQTLAYCAAHGWWLEWLAL